MNQQIFFQIEKEFPLVSAADIAIFDYPYVHFTRQYREYILYFVLSGDLYLREGAREYHLEKNDYILLDPSREHSGTEPAECQFFYVHFILPCTEIHMTEDEVRNHMGIEEGIFQTKLELKSQTSSILLPKQAHIETASKIIECERLIQEILGHRQQPGIYATQLEECLVWQLLVNLGSDFTRHLQVQNAPIRGKAQQLIPELLSFLHQFYASDISGELLEQEFNYNFDYLNRLFKRHTGQTIFGYLNALRIERAKQLLSTGFYSIAEIAEKTGFRDVYYFSRVFKKLTGVTPGEYREQRRR